MSSKTASTVADDKATDKVTPPTAAYSGVTLALFDAWRDGSLVKELTAASKAADKELTDEQQAEVAAFTATLDETQATAMASMATLDDFGKVADIVAATQAEVAGINLAIADVKIASSKAAFQQAMATLSIPIRLASGVAGAPSEFFDHVYRVKAFKVTRFYVPYDDKVEVYSVAGDGKASLALTISKETYPNVHPTSATAIQRLHYIMFATCGKTWDNKLKRVKAADVSWPTWNLAVGIASSNTNGSNSTTVLDDTPTAWVAANLAEIPPAKPTGKASKAAIDKAADITQQAASKQAAKDKAAS